MSFVVRSKAPHSSDTLAVAVDLGSWRPDHPVEQDPDDIMSFENCAFGNGSTVHRWLGLSAFTPTGTKLDLDFIPDCGSRGASGVVRAIRRRTTGERTEEHPEGVSVLEFGPEVRYETIKGSSVQHPTKGAALMLYQPGSGASEAALSRFEQSQISSTTSQLWQGCRDTLSRAKETTASAVARAVEALSVEAEESALGYESPSQDEGREDSEEQLAPGRSLDEPTAMSAAYAFQTEYEASVGLRMRKPRKNHGEHPS